MFKETVKVKNVDNHVSDIIKTFKSHGIDVNPSHVAILKTKGKEADTNHTFVIHHPPQNNRVLSDKEHKDALNKINDKAEKDKNIVHMHATDVSHESNYQKKYPGNRISLVKTPNTLHGRRPFNSKNIITIGSDE